MLLEEVYQSQTDKTKMAMLLNALLETMAVTIAAGSRGDPDTINTILEATVATLFERTIEIGNNLLKEEE
jgi:hypothetical protein